MGNISVNPQPYPTGTLVMYQNWRRLLFLHWAWDPAEIQATLPPGLQVDRWEGRAWLGIVPFRMEGVRPRFCPALPLVSNFPELNVRTYVRDRHDRPGVWFYSLDCSQPLAVWAARKFFGLPYFHARMHERVEENIAYECRRAGAPGISRFEYRAEGDRERAKEGALEQFLIERYRLFAARGERLLTGEVWHKPYPLQHVKVSRWDITPLRQAGFTGGGESPDHVIFSPGVDTRIFGVEPV